jgi:hypothetical protein
MDDRLPTLPLDKQAVSDAARLAISQDAGKYLAAILAASLGAGVTSRALGGFARLGKRDKPLPTALPATPVLLPRPKTLEEEESKYAALKKMAAGEDPSMLDRIGSSIGEKIFKGSPGSGMANRWWGLPLFWPLALGGGAAAMYGGYKLTDKILDMQRQHELERSLAKSKQEYERAVQERLKAAEYVDNTGAVDLLDDLAMEGIKKQADSIKDKLMNAGATGLSLYATYALLAALGAGKMTYDITRKTAPGKITEKALAERARQRYGMTPPMYITQEEKQQQPVL